MLLKVEKKKKPKTNLQHSPQAESMLAFEPLGPAHVPIPTSSLLPYLPEA